MKTSCIPLLAVLLPFSTSCDRVKEVVKKSSEAALEQAKSEVGDQIQETLAGSDVLKSAQNLGALGELDLNSLKRRVGEMKTAISSGNYAEAERLGASVDKLFGSEVVGHTIGLMKIRTEQGAEAAKGKLGELLAHPDLSAGQRQHLEKVGSYLANFDLKDRDKGIKILALAVASGCEEKLGQGGGGLVLMALDAILPGIVDKSGELPAEELPLERE